MNSPNLIALRRFVISTGAGQLHRPAERRNLLSFRTCNNALCPTFAALFAAKVGSDGLQLTRKIAPQEAR